MSSDAFTASAPLSTEPQPRSPLRLLLWMGLATFLLHSRSVLFPMLYQDDFGILSQSRTEQRTRESLWVPQNEHAMPLGRLFTFLVERVAGRAANLPLATSLVGPLFLQVNLGLLYLFVRRELGHPLYGLVAVLFFGVTSVYQQAVGWFAASFSIIALVFQMLGLLAAQSWRRSGRGLHLDLTALWCLVSPFWFGSGILAGPVCCLYLLWPNRTERIAPPGRIGHWSAVPLMGTVFFLLINLPRMAEKIMNLNHYQGRTAVQAFDPWQGLLSSGRSVADNLFLGVVGISCVHVPVLLVPPLLLGLTVLGVWWSRGGSPRLGLLGFGLIASNYWLIYSARAAWGYENVMNQTNWSRYHLLSQLGLSLLIVSGLPGRVGSWFVLDDTGRIPWTQMRTLLRLMVLLFVLQAPRIWFWYEPERPAQRKALLRIDAVEDRCRRHGIDAATARAALPPLDMPGDPSSADDPSHFNGWDLLRGSDTPRPLSVEEAQRLLQEE